MHPQDPSVKKYRPGGIVHTYQKYDPAELPGPASMPDTGLVDAAFEQALRFGNASSLSEEELERAIRLDASQLAGLGPSLDYLKALLEERKRQILDRYEVGRAEADANAAYRKKLQQARPPASLRGEFKRASQSEQIYLLESLWYRADLENSPFALTLLQITSALEDKYQIEALAANYAFRGRESMSVERAIEIKKELEEIDELLRQLEEAAKTAQIAIIDLDALATFAEPEALSELERMRRQIERLLQELAERQGLAKNSQGQYQLTPKAYRIFQGKLLGKIFDQLQESRSGRHGGGIVGEGSVELPSTRPYEFGDSLANLDTTQSVINAILKCGGQVPMRLTTDDLEIHRTRNSPKCATVVIMDMSGSMRYDEQYVHVKRMAIAFQGLIQREFPGDFLRFVEMSTFAKWVSPAELIELLPKPVTLHDPWVRLKADMSQEGMTELQVHPHFTNIQHALRIARQHLAAVDTPNRQIVLITDGLPTAHFEEQWLYMLYPPDPRTESATMREALACAKMDITINLFLIPSWSQSKEDIQFAYRVAEATKGRVFFTAGKDLDRFVVWDYLTRKREILS